MSRLDVVGEVRVYPFNTTTPNNRLFGISYPSGSGFKRGFFVESSSGGDKVLSNDSLYVIGNIVEDVDVSRIQQRDVKPFNAVISGTAESSSSLSSEERPELTNVFIPSNMMRLLEDNPEEIGGILIFKDGGNKTLRLDAAMFIAGDAKEVKTGTVIDRFRDQTYLFLFHTHPVRSPRGYLGLSHADMYWILNEAFTLSYDTPRVSHMLVTDQDVHITTISDKAYNDIKKLRDNYRTYRRGAGKSKVNAEFNSGMHFLFYIVERVCANEASDTDGLSLLDKFTFLPNDVVLRSIIGEAGEIIPRLKEDYVPLARISEDTFITWFSNPKNHEEQYTLEDNPIGLFYSSSLSRSDFTTRDNAGAITLNDGGSVYERYLSQRGGKAVSPVKKDLDWVKESQADWKKEREDIVGGSTGNPPDWVKQAQADWEKERSHMLAGAKIIRVKRSKHHKTQRNRKYIRKTKSVRFVY